MTVLFWFLCTFFGIIVVYIAIRLWSSAFFRSKQDFLTWLKKFNQEEEN